MAQHHLPLSAENSFNGIDIQNLKNVEVHVEQVLLEIRLMSKQNSDTVMVMLSLVSTLKFQVC